MRVPSDINQKNYLRMKITFHNIIIFSVAAILTLSLQSCEDPVPDSPPEKIVAADSILTIAQLRAKFTGTPINFSGNFQIFGVMTSDEQSGNFHRSHFIQDATGAICIRFDSGDDHMIGDSVRVSLRNTTMNAFNNLLQVDRVVYQTNVVIQATNRPVAPRLVTIPEILAGGLQGMLIRLENVQVVSAELARPFTGNITLEDCNGNRIILRTSSFANFANSQVPQGRGSIVAIVSVFGTTWQLLLRSIDEIYLSGQRCGTP